MKSKVFTLVLVLMLCVSGAWAGEASSTATPTSPTAKCEALPDKYSCEFVSENNLSKNDIYNGTLLWLAETFKSSKSVIELKDKELGKIIGNIALDLNIDRLGIWPVYQTYEFSLKIDIKDNKYRLTFTNVNDVSLFKKGEYYDPFYGNQAQKELSKLSEDLAKYLSNYKPNDNF